jgi:hypothetical protein
MHDLMSALLKSAATFDEARLLPIADQEVALTCIAEKGVPSFKIGQFVERNELGLDRYRFPLESQLAIVTAIFAEPRLDKEVGLTHGEIACLFEKDSVRFFPVDFRFYKAHLKTVS